MINQCQSCNLRVGQAVVLHITAYTCESCNVCFGPKEALTTYIGKHDNYHRFVYQNPFYCECGHLLEWADLECKNGGFFVNFEVLKEKMLNEQVRTKQL